jgi:hypothetical protein
MGQRIKYEQLIRFSWKEWKRGWGREREKRKERK